MTSNSKQSVFTKGRLTRLSIGVLFISVILWMLDYEEPSIVDAKASAPVLKVSTLTAVPQEHQVKVNAIGTTQPRWQVNIVASVSGRVEEFPSQLEPGALIKKEQLLLAIDDVPYQSDLAIKHSQVKQAELEVARIRHEKTVTEQISERRELSAFGRLEPHLAAAEAQLVAAQKSFVESKKNLSETRQVSPFDALLLAKWVVPGQWINAGDRLFQLAVSNSIDIQIELSAQQLKRLGDLNAQSSILIRDQNDNTWHASLRYREPLLSSQTRQTRLVLSVDSPYSTAEKLYPQSMVSVYFSGPKMANVIAAPASVLTSDGKVWTVENDTLLEADIIVIEESDNTVFFQFESLPAQPRQLVRFPLSSMLTGQRVQAINSSSHEVSSNETVEANHSRGQAI